MRGHYFQRYHQKEDAETANLVYLLRYLYVYSPARFNTFMTQLLSLDDDFDSDIGFNMQVKSETSRLDAVISQHSFKLAIETKLTDWFHQDQLENHLKVFSDNNFRDDFKVLLTISSEPMEQGKLKKFEATLADFNSNLKSDKCTGIRHVNTTFEEVCKVMYDTLDDVRDIEMLDILDDYNDLCHEDNLISKTWREMRAIAVGQTLDWNSRNLFYYNRETGRNHHIPQKFIGLYSNKEVRYVGEVCNVIKATWDEKTQKVLIEDNIDCEDREIIKKRMMEDINLQDGTVLFYKVKDFYPTSFRKVSKGGILSAKKFYLEDFIPDIAETSTAKEVADRLNGLTFE